MSNDQNVQQVIKTFLQEGLTYGLDEGFNPEADLIDQGIIDSMSLVRLVSFLEEQFHIQVRDEELVPENFRSLAAIEEFVNRARRTAN